MQAARSFDTVSAVCINSNFPLFHALIRLQQLFYVNSNTTTFIVPSSLYIFSFVLTTLFHRPWVCFPASTLSGVCYSLSFYLVSFNEKPLTLAKIQNDSALVQFVLCSWVFHCCLWNYFISAAGVFMRTGVNKDLAIDVLLTILGFIPVSMGEK